MKKDFYFAKLEIEFDNRGNSDFYYINHGLLKFWKDHDSATFQDFLKGAKCPCSHLLRERLESWVALSSTQEINHVFRFLKGTASPLSPSVFKIKPSLLTTEQRWVLHPCSSTNPENKFLLFIIKLVLVLEECLWTVGERNDDKITAYHTNIVSLFAWIQTALSSALVWKW